MYNLVAGKRHIKKRRMYSMKKLTALVLALVMLFGITLAETVEKTAVMTLYMTTMSSDDSVVELASLGMSGTLTVYDDNTYVIVMNGVDSGEEIETGVYTETEEAAQLISDDGSSVYDLGFNEETGEITMAYEGSVIALSITDPSIQLPSAVAAADIADFNGTWNATFIDAFGMKLDIASAMEQGLGELLGADDDLSIVIDNGSVSVFGQEAIAFEFTDGQLVMPMDLGDGVDLSMSVVMTDDGGIMYTLMGMNIYFTK